ncbi:hypothetical protein Nepgr_024870 [Nepenthes gracilis]|uniref:Spindle and kinetochore-associated protein 3 n=1 Tax=Nepenthes gracilis TaxID=150966 RepID=A0AAD3T6R5_NEPGR|nr:hypothetical protein Nepgr_024870 [Nepenthes gracilis]
MEGSITQLSQNLASFCNQLESSCDALRQSVDRRPIPLDSASTTFIQSLNRRLSPLASDLNLLESMSFNTVSFEELLGHCNEVYKQNQADLLQLHCRLQSLGYISSSFRLENDEEDDVRASNVTDPSILDLESRKADGELDLLTDCGGSIMKSLKDGSLFEDSLNLKSLGLSDACLAAIESEGYRKIDEVDHPFDASLNRENEQTNTKGQHQLDEASFNRLYVKDGDKSKFIDVSRSLIIVSKDDYEGLPSYLKSLASWEDLQTAIERMNSSLSNKQNLKESNHFHSEELESIGLGMTYIVYLY